MEYLKQFFAPGPLALNPKSPPNKKEFVSKNEFDNYANVIGNSLILEHETPHIILMDFLNDPDPHFLPIRYVLQLSGEDVESQFFRLTICPDSTNGFLFKLDKAKGPRDIGLEKLSKQYCDK